MRRFATKLGTGFALLALASPFAARDAHACGGCFSPPGPNLVVQDAERILFARDPKTGKTVVTIEVRYSGPANDFAWVLPLPSKPKVGVSSSYVFDRLDQATAPRFTTVREFSTEGCSFSNVSANGVGCGGAFASRDEATSGSGGVPTSNNGGFRDGRGVKVLESSQAGPYDYSVIQGDNAKGLLDWLNANKFATPASALPVLDAHVAKGDVFVAFKLHNGSGLAEIRPVMLEMEDADPCVPLRLTAIAAAEEMAVIVYTLGEGRAVPKNHMHVQVNPLRLRWDGGVENYPQVLAAAIDEAAGHAFATEFAGPAASVSIEEPTQSFAVDRTALYGRLVTSSSGSQRGQDVSAGQTSQLQRSAWRAGKLFPKDLFDLSGLETAKPTAAGVATWLKASGFLMVGETASTLEAATGLAAAHARTDVLKFWVDVRNNAVNLNSGLDEAVDLQSLATDLKLGIVEPIFLIQDQMATKGTWLSRVHMRISPEEMDRDPIFAFNASLEPVSTDWSATLADVCQRDSSTIDATRLRLEGSPVTGSWVLPNTTIDFDANVTNQTSTNLSNATSSDARWKNAPAALRVEVLEETGEPKVLARAQIDLVDAAIIGALPGQVSVPASLKLEAAGDVFVAPKDDEHVSLKVDAKAAAPDDGCTMGGSARSGLATMVLMLLGMALLWSRRLRLRG